MITSKRELIILLSESLRFLVNVMVDHDLSSAIIFSHGISGYVRDWGAHENCARVPMGFWV
jgi:hypothetical protein